MYSKLLTILLFLAVATNGTAENRLLKKLSNLLDTMAIRGMDRNYVELPEKPWQVILQSNFNQSDLKMKSTINGKEFFDDTYSDITLKPHVRTDISSYVGVWVGYRGYGIGYSKNVGGDKGSLWKFGAVGGKYGINLRIHTFKTDEPKVHLISYEPKHVDTIMVYQMENPIRARSMTLDAYYLFNGNKFSHCAAYDQSVIQRRSAGSLMVGAMYYHSSVRYDDASNAELIMFMQDIGKIKQTQVNIGAGYTYNWVPCRGLLINAMAMPMLTIYNRIDTWRYDSTLRQWLVQFEPYDISDDEIELWEIGKDVHYSRWKVNVDARLSITYNVGNWFFNANGQLSNFRYSHDNSNGRLTDWYINASAGIRL